MNPKTIDQNRSVSEQIVSQLIAAIASAGSNRSSAIGSERIERAPPKKIERINDEPE
jgi:hypothetical protein